MFLTISVKTFGRILKIKRSSPACLYITLSQGFLRQTGQLKDNIGIFCYLINKILEILEEKEKFS